MGGRSARGRDEGGGDTGIVFQTTGAASGARRRRRPLTGHEVGTPGHGRFVVVPAAYVFLLRETRDSTEVLLQLRQHTGYMDGHWAAAAAGHVERGETAYDAARREAIEEIAVHDLELEFVTAMHRSRGADPIDERIDFFFSARRWSGEPRIVEPEKCAELRWCRLDALPEPVVPHERVVLDAMAAGTDAPGLGGYSSYGFEEDR